MNEDFVKLEPLLITLAHEYVRCEPEHYGQGSLSAGSPRGEEIIREAVRLANEHGFSEYDGKSLLEDYVGGEFKQMQDKLRPEMIRFQEIRSTLRSVPGGPLKPFAHAVSECQPFIDAVAKMQAEGFTPENAHKFVYSEILRQKEPGQTRRL
jgi:hypothetical protein